jgi:hypothetical protein
MLPIPVMQGGIRRLPLFSDDGVVVVDGVA